MKYDNLVETFANQPFFETGDLLTLYTETEKQILPRLARWVSRGKLLQLRRGKYLLPQRHQKQAVHPFFISNYLYSPSYISLFTALAYYQLIPEDTPLVQAVTSRATRHWETELGNFQFHSLNTERFLGYEQIQLGNSTQQVAFVASPEKALVDICLLNSGPWDANRWAGLRLQHTARLNPDILIEYSVKIPGRRLAHGIQALVQLLQEQS